MGGGVWVRVLGSAFRLFGCCCWVLDPEVDVVLREVVGKIVALVEQGRGKFDTTVEFICEHPQCVTRYARMYGGLVSSIRNGGAE